MKAVSDHLQLQEPYYRLFDALIEISYNLWYELMNQSRLLRRSRIFYIIENDNNRDSNFRAFQERSIA